MKLFFKKLIIILFITVILYSILIIIFSGMGLSKFILNLTDLRNKSYSNIRYSEVDTIRDIDILFLGSSHTYRGFDPRIFESAGYSSFNLGSSSQTPVQTKYLLDRYLDQLNPGLVIMDVYPLIFGLDGDESSLDLLYNDSIGMDSLKMVFDTPGIRVINAFIASAAFQLFSDVPRSGGPEREYDTYIPGGYVESSKKANASPGFIPMGTIKMKPIQKKRFEQIISLLNKKGIAFILVQTPVYSRYYDTLENASEFDEYFNSFGTYINFNNVEYGKYDGLTFDSHHLNRDGVKLFNDTLIRVFSNYLEK